MPITQATAIIIAPIITRLVTVVAKKIPAQTNVTTTVIVPFAHLDLSDLGGPQGPVGETGPAGPARPQGPAGGVLNYADFYVLMPPDNTATVAPGTDVSFPQDSPNSGADISRTGPSTFNLAQIGTYQVLFQVSVDEAGQLMLALNGEDLAYTVVGRATGASQIVGMALVTTTVINSLLTVRNPAGTAAALTITPLAGGTCPVSAHLIIMQIG